MLLCDPKAGAQCDRLFFKHVLDIEEPVFGVRLRKTSQRVPVVLSKRETAEIFEMLEEAAERQPANSQPYALAARLQYGAGLRRSELVRLGDRCGTMQAMMRKGNRYDFDAAEGRGWQISPLGPHP